MSAQPSFRAGDDGQLVLTWQSGPDATAGDLTAWRQALAAAGFGAWAIDEAALQKAFDQANAAAASFQATVGRRLDGSCKVLIAADKLSASLAVTPPRGGEAVTAEQAAAALAAARVSHGISAEAVAAAVAAMSGEPAQVATATPVVPPVDAVLEALVEVNRQRRPKVDAHDRADYHDLGGFPMVKEGEALMRRHPPVPGQPGCNVLGEVLPAGNPKDLKFPVRAQGVAPDPADPDLLRAVVAGQPVLLRDGIMVEPVLKLPKVDLSVGNVRFDGSVEIAGDVATGMRIEAGGDIVVGGVVEAAELVAGGDIAARGGVIGHAVAGKGNGEHEKTAHLHAKGNVAARYIENAVVMAEKSVFTDEAAIQSDVMAIDEVQIGIKKGGKGRVIGGLVRATHRVTAEYLGGPGSGATRVVVGINPLLQQAHEAAKDRLSAKLKEHGEVSKVVKLLAGRPDKADILEKARLTLRKIGEEIAEATAAEKALLEEIKLAAEAQVEVTRGVHAGVTVVIGRKSMFVPDDRGPGVFYVATEADGREELKYGLPMPGGAQK